VAPPPAASWATRRQQSLRRILERLKKSERELRLVDAGPGENTWVDPRKLANAGGDELMAQIPLRRVP
jgi:hypothetical protein